MGDLAVIYRQVSELKPYQRNARVHSPAQIKQIADSIKRFGFTNPVLVDDADKIIAGHGRVAAAQLLGLCEVPTVRLSHLGAAEKRAYIVADNRIAEKAGWDRDILAIELQALVDLDFEVELTGFDLPEIKVILNDEAGAKSKKAKLEDGVPDPLPGPAVSRPGDLWILGDHRLLCADARDDGSYRRLLNTDQAAFMFTALPDHAPELARHGDLVRPDDHDPTAYRENPESGLLTDFLAQVFSNLAAHSIDGSIHQICARWQRIAEIMSSGKQVYCALENLCVWNKTHAEAGSLYGSQHSLVFVWKSGAAPAINNLEGPHGRKRTDVWEYASPYVANSGMVENAPARSSTPVGLVADAIKDFSRRKDLVLDPFCGTGTVLIAAHRTARKARALESDPDLVDVAVRRWQAHAGRAAMHDGGGDFDSIARRRVAGPLPV